MNLKVLLLIFFGSFFSLATINDLHQTEETKALKNDESETLTRAEQIQRCASCHPKEYQNEMIGPHAASYTKLMDNVRHVRSSDNFTEDWKNAVLTEFENCIGCHSPGNIYESIYAAVAAEKDESKFSDKDYPELKTLAPGKKGDDLLSGVDCLTCHVKGNQVLTNSRFIPSGIVMKGQCDVHPSKFFSTDMNCSISCHRNLYTQTKKNLKDGLVEANEVNCIKCHQEYEQDGKGTHYYYWKHDSAKKRESRPKSHTPFACISIALKHSEEGYFVSFEWNNRNAPHGYPNSAEYLIELNLINPRHESKYLGAARINRKCIEDLNLQYLFKDTIPGFVGYDNYVKTEPLHREYPLNTSEVDSSKVLVYLKFKNPYWTKDSEFIILDSMIYNLQ